jgi:cell fate regulator YaaT (PSP1 superfamily)
MSNIETTDTNITEAAVPKKACKSCRCNKLETFDWLSDIQSAGEQCKLVEVRFKNTRKDYFENNSNIQLEVGDLIAVEASPGHDIGEVSLTGSLVLRQLSKMKIPLPPTGFKKIYRKARPADIEKWTEARSLEQGTMIKTRQIAKKLNLSMKIGDVEYQGDKTKAIFYYIADERVDFRELIKILADEFKIRIEMRQIGARQEAARIGGLGSCGKELCCAQFMNRFVSVSTNSARIQELSLNPQKLAGQCGKLKCCLNYEADSYLDAIKDFPDPSIKLLSQKGDGRHIKTDVYKRLMWYVVGGENSSSIVQLSIDKVKEIIRDNKKGVPVPEIKDEAPVSIKPAEKGFEDVVGQESLTRFDEAKSPHKKNSKNKNRNRNNKNKRRPPNGNSTQNAD